ncbi:MAG: hypothetical protein ACK5WZ_15415, partial [Pseudobdellovibrionaceae bacterium]
MKTESSPMFTKTISDLVLLSKSLQTIKQTRPDALIHRFLAIDDVADREKSNLVCQGSVTLC